MKEYIWPPAYKYRCKKCDDVLQSATYGEVVTCKCKALFVDQTPYYTRIGGNREDIEEIKVEDTKAEES